MSKSKPRPEAPPYHNINGRAPSAKELGKSHYSQLKHQLDHSLDTLIMVLRQVDEEAKSYERQIKKLQATNQQLVEALEHIQKRSAINKHQPLMGDLYRTATKAITNAKQREE